MDRLLLKMYKAILNDIEETLRENANAFNTEPYQTLYALGNDYAQMIADLEYKLSEMR